MPASVKHRLPRLDDAVERHLRTDVTPLKVDQTIGQALEQIRSRQQGGRIIYFYVVDDDGRLQGVVPTRLLLLSPLDQKLADVMIRKVMTLPRTATVMDACEIFVFHKFLALPVVDEQKRLLGVVDIELYTDEITDLAQRTSYEDLFQLIGVRALRSHGATPLKAFGQRFPWLICNIVGGILAAFLTGAFQETLDHLVVLALFIPVVLTLAEAVGIQSVSLALQTLHEPNVGWRQILGTLRRELWTGLLLGFATGPIVGLVAWIWKQQPNIAWTILLSISLTMTASAMIGMALPLILHLFKRDPRVAAGPVALVFADLTTLFLYFGLSTLFLM
ncbi:magnesium transporter [Paludisphaera borealis]|uniref:Magnesium transporter MgtE n=1 Tax=Paludisphaera borealis TaxID=1387353 RepID=A0A1U7CT60_9BACT|nr:magnesium transporter [Paludisphaera borealis]APW62111.1 Magnesium transporter MgtE [Paludisphaera borealis]